MQQIKCTQCGSLIDIKEKTEDSDIVPEFATKKLYVSAEIGLRMRTTPEIKKDNISEPGLPYGSEVLVMEEQEKWFKVNAGGRVGWVSCYYLIENSPIQQSSELSKKESAQNLLPAFKPHYPNLAKDDNTVKLRKIIKDEFGGGVNGWDLQCTEYVHYRVQQMGININWPNERPRHGGRWAVIFENSGQYKVSNEPTAGSAMSFTSGLKNSTVGHVAFVEEIYENGSIKISEANWPPPGKYYERILAKSEWQDKYKGKFINFT